MKWHHYAAVAITVVTGLAAIAMLLTDAHQAEASATGPARIANDAAQAAPPAR
jgi:hypothetical protein